MNKYCVYFHTKLNEELPFYIGIGGTKKRPYSKWNRNPYWHNIVNKYGYIIDTEYKNLTYEQARQLEIDLIKFYGRQDLGTGILVNMTNGGEGRFGSRPSDETRKKMSVTMSNRLIGKPSSIKGWTKLSKDKVREIQTSYEYGKMGYRKLAKRYGVSYQTIKRYVRGEP